MAGQRFRTTDALFSTISIADIRGVVQGKQREIDGKKQQLRELVGSHYHDLVEASDAIVELDVGAKGVLKMLPALRNVRRCRRRCSQPAARACALRSHARALHRSLTLPPCSLCTRQQLLEDFAAAALEQGVVLERAATLQQPGASTSRSWLRHPAAASLALGSPQRGLAFVKLLLHAPESIVSDAECGAMLDAAVGLLVAQRACAMVECGGVTPPPRVAAWVPRSNSLRHFPSQIDTQCSALLATPGLSAEACAGALAAQILLGRLPLDHLVAKFLATRTQWVTDALAGVASAAASDAPASGAASAAPIAGGGEATLAIAHARLQRLVAAVRDTIVHAAALFPPAAAPMVPLMLRESAARLAAIGGGESLSPRRSAGCGAGESEEAPEAVWATLARAPSRAFDALSAEATKNECTSWLESQLQRIWDSPAVLSGITTMQDMAGLHLRTYSHTAASASTSASRTGEESDEHTHTEVVAEAGRSGGADEGELDWSASFDRVVFRGEMILFTVTF